MRNRTTSSRPPAGPPANAEAGAALVRDFVVKLYDKQDGQGVAWRTIAETLFRASFDVLDRLPDDQKQAVARRVHAGSYDRIAGNAPVISHEPAGDAVAVPNVELGRLPLPRGPR